MLLLCQVDLSSLLFFTGVLLSVAALESAEARTTESFGGSAKRQHKIMSGHCGQVTIDFLGVSSDFVVCLSASSVFLCGQVGSTLVTFARSFW